ncbi:MAG TPA: hypothetical protein EYM54_15980 [Dehalococcoidia bacterium]|jgi:hypothetical protein|nr:hypothetical protein [Dehalococcoidia bacterium]
MSGAKDAYQIDLSSEQIAFLRSAQEQYNIPDESKVVRIIVDYLMSNPDIQETVFDETRCLWCG